MGEIAQQPLIRSLTVAGGTFIGVLMLEVVLEDRFVIALLGS